MVNSSRRRKKGAKSKGSSAPSCSRARSKDDHDAREAENAQRLDKLLPDVWEKILDELEENDLFPLALSCRYFRQKQKELVARSRQQGPESGVPRRALRTTFTLIRTETWNDKPVSADYVRFCRKEKLPREVASLATERFAWIVGLAAFHGYLPLLQDLLPGLESRPRFDRDFVLSNITKFAGESSSS